MFNKKTDFVSMRKEFHLGMYIPVPICLLNSRFSSTKLLVYGSLLFLFPFITISWRYVNKARLLTFTIRRTVIILLYVTTALPVIF